MTSRKNAARVAEQLEHIHAYLAEHGECDVECIEDVCWPWPDKPGTTLQQARKQAGCWARAGQLTAICVLPDGGYIYANPADLTPHGKLGERYQVARHHLLQHGGAITLKALARIVDLAPHKATGWLKVWCEAGALRRVERGVYALPGADAPAAQHEAPEASVSDGQQPAKSRRVSARYRPAVGNG